MILTSNYGEAGAIDTFGPSLGLPAAVSGELTYYFWRPARMNGPVLAVGMDVGFLSTLFEGCSPVGTVSNAYGLRNQEFGDPIVMCARARMPLDELWPRFKRFE